MLTQLRARSALFLVLAAIPAGAAVFPEMLGEFTRGEVTTPKIADVPLYTEFSLQSAEQAQYASDAAKFTATAWRMRDTTGAFALYQSRRPADAVPSDVTKVASKTATSLLLLFGNYVIEFDGRVPALTELNRLFATLPDLDMSALPNLPAFLPKEDLVPNSERYILGPVSLQRYQPGISPSLAAFSLSAEAQLARYHLATGDLTLTIFNYPTPNMARERQEAFLKVPGVLAKRAGPLVAVVIPPVDSDAAERVLGKVQYEAKITRQDLGKNPAKDLANLVLTGMLLAGVIGGASLLAGLWLGGSKWLLKKFGWYREPEAFTLLRLHEHRADKAPENNP
ncbi:MAG: DUF6599 family protein [Acidobacteriota bacterium]